MATKKTTSEKVEKVKSICINCNSEIRKDLVYTCRNDLITEPFTLCKACSQRIANESVDGMHRVLRILDVPFIPEVYKDVEASENMFSDYMLRMNNPRKKFDNGKTYLELRYVDSPTLEEVKDVNQYLYASDEKIADLYSLFGSKWSKEELLAMNKELDDMIVQYGGAREDIPTMDLYCELIRLKWLARKQMDENNIKDGKALVAERNKMLKENNMTMQAMKEKSANESFGVEIDYAEYRPIKPKKKYFDYSGLMHMFKYFITHQERFYGDNQKPIDDDYAEMATYKSEHPKEYKAEMFPDDYDFNKEDEVEDEDE